MKRLLAFFGLCCLLASSAGFALTSGENIILFGGCPSQATQFFARARGALANKSNYCRLIAGLVNAGIWQQLDVLYIFAAPTQSVALTNLVSSSFGATAVNSPTFTAYRGIAGNGSTSYVNTNFNPATAGGKYTLNNGHLSVWDLTTRSANAVAAMGAANAGFTQQVAIYPFHSTGSAFFGFVNDSPPNGIAVSGSAGFSLVSRTTSTISTLYRNGVSLGSPGSDTSVGIPSNTIIIGAINNGGIGGQTTDRFGAASIGSSLSPVQELNFYNAVQSYLHTVGAV